MLAFHIIMIVKPKTINEKAFVQPGLFDDPVVLQSSTKLAETDTFIIETKKLIKELVAQNKSTQRSMSRYDIEKSIVEAYKSLSKAYGNKPDKQQQLHYKKVYDTLNWILFNPRNKKLHSGKKIRDHILKVVKGLNNKNANTARDLAQLWRNLLTASIHAAEGVAQKEFPIPAELPLQTSL